MGERDRQTDIWIQSERDTYRDTYIHIHGHIQRQRNKNKYRDRAVHRQQSYTAHE